MFAKSALSKLVRKWRVRMGVLLQFATKSPEERSASGPVPRLDIEATLQTNATNVAVAMETCEVLQQAMALLQESVGNLGGLEGAFPEPDHRQAVEDQLMSLRSRLSREQTRLASAHRLLGTASKEAFEAKLLLEAGRITTDPVAAPLQ